MALLLLSLGYKHINTDFCALTPLPMYRYGCHETQQSFLGHAYIYVRHQELGCSGTVDGTPTTAEDVSDLGLFQQQQDGRDDGSDFPGGRGIDAAGAKMYSAQEMKQRYYEAFWRARCDPRHTISRG